MEEFGFPLSRDRIYEIISVYDYSEKGGLNFTEFEHLLKDQVLSDEDEIS